MEEESITYEKFRGIHNTPLIFMMNLRLYNNRVTGQDLFLEPQEFGYCGRTGGAIARVLYELQWPHLCPIMWKLTSVVSLQSLQSIQTCNAVLFSFQKFSNRTVIFACETNDKRFIHTWKAHIKQAFLLTVDLPFYSDNQQAWQLLQSNIAKTN